MHPVDKYIAKILFKEDLFGENETLKINGFHAFGDVLALTHVTCMFLSKENISRIPFNELYIIKQHLANRTELKRLNYTCTQRYGVEIDTVRNY